MILNKKKPTVVVYRHCEAHPEGLGSDLLGFVDEIKKMHLIFILRNLVMLHHLQQDG
jgi:hypothetical protein